MKRFVWRWLAISSALCSALGLGADNRAQYGGTLHVSTHAALASLAPADIAQAGSIGQQNVAGLIFDTLVTRDEVGRIRPGLAITWRPVAGSQRWHFEMRKGVSFQDGTSLTPEIAASSLRAANPSWTVLAEPDAIVIEQNSADAEILAELALPRNAITKNSGDRWIGTGPFRITDWQPDKKLTLAANEEYWGGRPFLDSIEMEMGRTFRDEMTALEVGHTDLAEVAPEQVHRVSLDGRRLASSEPVELVALVFTRDPRTPEEKSVREALSLSIDRGTMRTVLLQGVGQPAASILPNWMSGYGFLFSTNADLAQARKQRDQARGAPAWTLGYEGSDGLARLVVERIALNAKDAGLVVQPTPAAGADMRLMRIPMASADPWIALGNISSLLGYPPFKRTGGTMEDLYKAEESVLATRRIIPLFHLPVTYAAAANVKNWKVRPDGSLGLLDAWLEGRRP